MSKSKSTFPRFLMVVCALWPCASFAGAPRDACAEAAKTAAAQSSVPLRILTAIYAVESGGHGDAQYSGWPWSINIAGAGHRFDTKEQAEEVVEGALNAGKRNIDIGCFQINIRWHSQNFSSLDEMFDPTINATYAAHYLSALYEKHGDWKSAVGAYHSNDPDRAETYTQKVEETLIQLAADGIDAAQPTARSETGQNRYPLFQDNSSASIGSTFPILAPMQPLIVLQ